MLVQKGQMVMFEICRSAGTDVMKGAGTERAGTDGDVCCMQVCRVVSVTDVTKSAGTERADTSGDV